MAMSRELNLEDYVHILKRHKWKFIVPSLLLGLVAFGFSFLLPREYQSEALILVEPQQVPRDYVKPTVSLNLQELLETMKQDILSRSRLQQFIEQFGLYRHHPEEQPLYKLASLLDQGLRAVGVDSPGLAQRFSRKPVMDELITLMQSKIEITLVHGQARGGARAFKISYTAETPELARQIATEISSLFIEENRNIREQLAANTSEFIEHELEAARKELESQEAKLREFKSRYMGELPQQQQANLQLLSQLEFQLHTVEASLDRLQQQDLLLRNSLDQRKTELKAQEEALGGGQTPVNLRQRLLQLQAQLVQLESKYKPDYPDVVRLKQEIAQVRSQLEQDDQQADANSTPAAPRAAVPDPQLTRLQSQLEVNQLERQRLLEERKRIQRAIETYRRRIELTPLREQEYIELTRDYGIAKNTYESLLLKQKNSEMASNLEKRQRGEQFRVTEPARLPAKPYRPKRGLILLGGALTGLLIGLGCGVTQEVLNKSLRNERDVEFYLELPVLAMVPVVEWPEEKQSPRILTSRRGASAKSSAAQARV